MRWQLSDGGDPVARAVADRHYNRQSPGSAKFTPPGSNVVFRTGEGQAVWSTAWPLAEYVRHEWAGAWINTIFRNESPHLSSELILEAVAATRFLWGEPPELGLVTMVDRSKVRAKRDPGYCYLRAGFRVLGRTKINDLIVLGLDPAAMPAPEPPLLYQETLA